MIEDKLIRDERIRLESVAQAIASEGGRAVNTKAILTRAAAIEEYIKKGLQDDE